MKKAVREFLKEDRFWFREQRIAHAQYQITADKENKKFWEDVLKANQDEE